MKRKIPLTLLIFALLLTACGGSASEANPAQRGDVQGEFSLSRELTMLISTVKLDETEYSIDSTQAMELLPLWKAFKSLSESDTAASVEVEALVNQIEETMTGGQMEAITAMQLSIEDVAAVQEQLGIEGGFGDMTPEMQATVQAARQSGERGPGSGPGGGVPGGGPGGGQEHR